MELKKNPIKKSIDLDNFEKATNRRNERLKTKEMIKFRKEVRSIIKNKLFIVVNL